MLQQRLQILKVEFQLLQFEDWTKETKEISEPPEVSATCSKQENSSTLKLIEHDEAGEEETADMDVSYSDNVRTGKSFPCIVRQFR